MSKRESIWARLIPDLVRSPETIQTILKRHDCPRSTYYSRYAKNAEFQRRFAVELENYDDESRARSREKHAHKPEQKRTNVDKCRE